MWAALLFVYYIYLVVGVDMNNYKIEPFFRLYYKLHKALLAFSLAGKRTLATQLGPLILPHEQREALLYFNVNPELEISELSHALSLPLSATEKLILSLYHNGYLTYKKDLKESQNSKVCYEITSKTYKLIEKIESAHYKISVHCQAVLSREDIREILYWHKRITEKLTGKLPKNIGSSIHIDFYRSARSLHSPLTTMQLRESKIETIGKNLTYNDFQLLIHLDSNNFTTTINSLKKTLPLEENSLHRALLNLSSLKLIYCNDSHILLTVLGQELVMLKHSYTIEKLIEIYKEDKNFPLENLTCSLSKISNYITNKKISLTLSNTCIRQLKSNKERQKARGLLIDYLHKNKLQYTTCEEFFSSKGLSFGLFVNNELNATCQVFRKNNEIYLDNFACDSQLKIDWIRNFIAYACRAGGITFLGSKVKINKDRIGNDIYSHLPVLLDHKDQSYLNIPDLRLIKSVQEKPKKTTKQNVLLGNQTVCDINKKKQAVC